MSLQFSRTLDNDEFIDLKIDIECKLSGETHWTDPNNGINPHSDIIKITCYNEDDDEIDLYYTTDGEEYDIYEEAEEDSEINLDGVIEHLQETGRCSFPNGEVPETLSRLEEAGYICSFNQSDDYIILEDRICETELVNCTPHAVNLIDEDGNCYLTLQPSGIIPRCDEVKKHIETIFNCKKIKINKKSFYEVVDLPEPKLNTYYIVSALVAQGTAGRIDLVVPDDVVRNDKGQIIGCKSLAKL